MVLVPPSWEGDRNDLALAAAQHPDRFAVMGRLPLRDPASRAQVADWKKQPGMLGMRFTFHNEHNRPFLTDGSADWLWPAAERAGIPLMVLMPSALDILDRIAAAHPGLKLVIDHVGLDRRKANFWDDLPAICALAKHPNVALKASGMPSLSTGPIRSAICIRASAPWWTPSGPSARSGAPTSRACPARTTSASRSSPSICRGSRAKIWSGSWAAASASGSAGPCRRRDRHEIHLVQPDAVAVPAGRLPGEEPLGVGRHPQHPLRSPQGPTRSTTRASTRLEYAETLGFDGIGCNEAPPERLWADAVAQPDRGDVVASDVAGRAVCHRQLDCRLQPIFEWPKSSPCST